MLITRSIQIEFKPRWAYKKTCKSERVKELVFCNSFLSSRFYLLCSIFNTANTQTGVFFDLFHAESVGIVMQAHVPFVKGGA